MDTTPNRSDSNTPAPEEKAPMLSMPAILAIVALVGLIALLVLVGR